MTRKAADKNRHKKKAAMIQALCRTGIVGEAAREVGIHRDTHYEWVKQDPKYAAEVEHAMESAIDLLEAEAKRRAYEGVEEPVYQGGKQVGTIRKYSDTLLIFLMKGARPEKYRDRQQIEQTVSGSVTLNVVIPGEKE